MSKTTKKLRKSKVQKEPNKSDRIVILFGLDEDRKLRAARFVNENESLLAKAAAATGLRLAVPTAAQHLELTARLPLGHVNGTGKNFVPYVRQELHNQLSALVGGEPKPLIPGLPKSWDELAPGHVVIAQQTVADGWWAAVVTHRNEDTLTLAWRDYPNQPEFLRHISAVALLKND
jgi:hypothetical protein